MIYIYIIYIYIYIYIYICIFYFNKFFIPNITITGSSSMLRHMSSYITIVVTLMAQHWHYCVSVILLQEAVTLVVFLYFQMILETCVCDRLTFKFN